MARDYVADGTDVFRAVVTVTMTFDDGREPTVRTRTYGPYGTAAPAKARISSAQNDARWDNEFHDYRMYVGSPKRTTVVEGRVEKAAITWTDINAPEPVAETVTIPVTEYESLKEDERFLGRLQAAGVDNWEGYEYAFEDDEDDDA